MNRIIQFSLIFTFLLLVSCSKEENLGPPIIERLSRDFGQVGEEISIFGQNFGEDAKRLEVRFNGTIATIKHSSNGHIGTVVPDGATSGEVTVSRDNLTTKSPLAFKVSEWKKISELPTAISNSNNPPPMFFTACNEKLYAGLNGDNSVIWEYNPSTKTWLQKTVTPIEKPWSFAHFVLNNKIYFHFQFSQQGSFSDFYEYDPIANKWTKKADFPSTGAGAGKRGFSINGLGYFIFGNSVYGGDVKYKEVRVYNPENDTWAKRNDFPGEWKSGFGLYKTSSEVFIGGGFNNSSLTNEHWKYDPTFDQWQQTDNLPGENRHTPALFYINQKLYYGFGQPNGAGGFQDFWIFDGQDNQWREFSHYNFYMTGSFATIGNAGYGCDGVNLWEFFPELNN